MEGPTRPAHPRLPLGRRGCAGRGRHDARRPFHARRPFPGASWRAPFAALALLCAELWLWTWLAMPPMREHLGRPRLQPRAVLRAVFGPVAHRRAFALMIPLMFAGFTVIPFISPSLAANVGFSDLQLALIYLFGGLASVVTSPWIGRLADRFARAPCSWWQRACRLCRPSC